MKKKKNQVDGCRHCREQVACFSVGYFALSPCFEMTPGQQENPATSPGRVYQRGPQPAEAGRRAPSFLCVAPSTQQASARGKKQPHPFAFLAESSQTTSPKWHRKKQPRNTEHSSGLSPMPDGKEDEAALTAGYRQPVLLQLHGWAVFLWARAEWSWGGFHSLPASARKHICQGSGVWSLLWNLLRAVKGDLKKEKNKKGNYICPT